MPGRRNAPSRTCDGMGRPYYHAGVLTSAAAPTLSAAWLPAAKPSRKVPNTRPGIRPPASGGAQGIAPLRSLGECLPVLSHLRFGVQHAETDLMFWAMQAG